MVNSPSSRKPQHLMPLFQLWSHVNQPLILRTLCFLSRGPFSAWFSFSSLVGIQFACWHCFTADMLVKIKERIILKKNGLAHHKNFCKIRRRDKIEYSKVCLSYERDKEGGCCSKWVVKGMCILGPSAEPVQNSRRRARSLDTSRKWEIPKLWGQ